jgi:phosphoribosyl-ATP pyrophosphohydrolase
MGKTVKKRSTDAASETPPAMPAPAGMDTGPKKAAPKKAAPKKAGPKKAGPKKTGAKKKNAATSAAAATIPTKAPKRPGAKKGAAKTKYVVAPSALPAPPLAVGASSAVLDRLWHVVNDRRGADPAISHSARLLSRGTAKVAQKFGEEAVECLIEAVGGNHAALVAESADVLYHLIVMWVGAGVRPEEVWAELQRREGISGVTEKASRARALPLELGVGTTKIP